MHERLITLIWITIPCFWSSGFERCSIRAAKSPYRAHEALSRAQPTRPSTTTLTQIGPSGANWIVLAVVALVAILVGLAVWRSGKAEQTHDHPTPRPTWALDGWVRAQTRSPGDVLVPPHWLSAGEYQRQLFSQIRPPQSWRQHDRRRNPALTACVLRPRPPLAYRESGHAVRPVTFDWQPRGGKKPVDVDLRVDDGREHQGPALPVCLGGFKGLDPRPAWRATLSHER